MKLLRGIRPARDPDNEMCRWHTTRAVGHIGGTKNRSEYLRLGATIWWTRRSGRTRRGACEEEPAQENGSESGSIVESTGVNPSVVDESLTVPMDSEASTPTTRVAATAETPEAPAPECLAESKTNLETSSQASSAPSTDALDFLAAIAQLDANKENSEAMSPRVVQGEAIQASDKLQAPAESPGCFVQVPVHTQLI